MNAYTENDISIVAAVLVLLAAMCDPLLGAGLAGLALGASALLRFAVGH